MIDKKQNRLRRARATRARIKDMKVNRLTVHRTNLHIYAQIISADGKNVLALLPRSNPKFVLSSRCDRKGRQRQRCKTYRYTHC